MIVRSERAHSADREAPAAVPRGCAVLSADEILRMLASPHEDAHRTALERGLLFGAMAAPGEPAADLQAVLEPLG
jgi:hypothetical protein